MNARFAPIVPATPETRAPLSLIPNFGHQDMDETSTFVYVPRSAQDQLTDDQIEALNDEAEVQASTELLEDVRADMLSEWERARFWAGGLNPPKLPVIVEGKLEMQSFPQVLALCGETNHLYVMLADLFRGETPDALQLHLRSTWVDGYAEALADAGWRA